MIDADRLRLWSMRALYVALAGVLLFLNLLPFSGLPRAWSGPDFLLALTFAWAIRRPDYVPIWLIAAVMLTADLVLQRPPGLWAALAVMMAENLKTRGPRQKEGSFALEWTSVALALLGMTAIYQIVKLLLIVPPMAWTLALTQLIATVAVYPLAVGVSILIFGRGTLGESDRLGQGL